MAREVYAGPLHKCGGKVKSWKKRWMVLKDDHTFSYYKDAAKPPLGVISLMDSSFSAREGSALDTAWPKHTKMENTLVVVTTSRIYYMWAESPEEASDWRTHLTSAREKMLQEHQYTNRLLHNNRTQSDGSALRMQATQEPSNHALKYRPKEAVTIGNASPQSVHGKFNPNAKNPKWYQKKDRRQPTKRFGGAGEGEGEGEGEAVSHLSDERGPDGELVNDLGIYSQLSESMEEGAPVINSLKDSPLEAIYDEASEASESIAKESGRGKDLTTPTGNTESEYYIEMAEGTAREAEQLQSPVSPVSVYEELGPAAGAPPQGTAHTSPSRAKSPAKTSKKNSATSQPLPPVPVAMASSAPASCSAGVYELIGEGGGRGERGGGAMYEHIPEGMPLYESIEVGNEASRTQCTDSGSEEEGGGDNGAPPPPLPPKDDHVPPPPPLPPKNIVEDEVEAPPVATGETKAVVLPPEEALYDFVKSSGQADTEEPPTVAPTVAPVVNNSHAPQNEDDVIYDQPDELEEGKDLPREGIIDGGGVCMCTVSLFVYSVCVCVYVVCLCVCVIHTCIVYNLLKVHLQSDWQVKSMMMSSKHSTNTIRNRPRPRPHKNRRLATKATFTIATASAAAPAVLVGVAVAVASPCRTHSARCQCLAGIVRPQGLLWGRVMQWGGEGERRDSPPAHRLPSKRLSKPPSPPSPPQPTPPPPPPPPLVRLTATARNPLLAVLVSTALVMGIK